MIVLVVSWANFPQLITFAATIWDDDSFSTTWDPVFYVVGTLRSDPFWVTDPYKTEESTLSQNDVNNLRRKMPRFPALFPHFFSGGSLSQWNCKSEHSFFCSHHHHRQLCYYFCALLWGWHTELNWLTPRLTATFVVGQLVDCNDPGTGEWMVDCSLPACTPLSQFSG